VAGALDDEVEETGRRGARGEFGGAVAAERGPPAGEGVEVGVGGEAEAGGAAEDGDV
jgi:hypothetical protein